MELTWLEDFMTLANTGHFSRAATLRNSSQPAFSRRIQALEQWLGAPLFIRPQQGRRHLLLTPAGEKLKTDAAPLIRDIYRMRENAMEITANANATLRFAATHTLSSTFFPSWISQIDKNTQITTANVYLISDSVQSCEQALLQGQVDFLLSYDFPQKEQAALQETTSPTSLPDHMSGHIIGHDYLLPLCAIGEDNKPLWILPGNVKNPVRYLRYSPISGLSKLLENNPLYHNHLFSQQPQFTSHLASVLHALACEQQGIAWLPHSLAHSSITAGKLIRAGDKKWDVAMDIKLYRLNHPLNPAAEVFWKTITS